MFKRIAIYITIFLLLGMFLVPNRAFAQAFDYTKMIKITPVILNINLKPGQEQTYDLNLENVISLPLGVSLNIETLDATDELSGMVFGNPHANSPFVFWMSLSEKQFLIKEKDSKVVTLTVKIPKNAKEGSYTSVIFITPFVSKPLDKSVPTIVSRIGILVLADIGTPKEKQPQDMAKILNLDIRPSKNNMTEATVRVENTYNFNLSTKAKIELDPLLLGEQKIIELDDKRILAGKVRKWQDVFNLKPGIYKSLLTVSLGQGRLIYATTYFSVPSLSSFTKYLLLLLLIVLVILLRKRIKKAVSVLYKGA